MSHAPSVKVCTRWTSTGTVLLSGGHRRMHALPRECPRCMCRVQLTCEHDEHVHPGGVCEIVYQPIIVDGRLWHDVCVPGYRFPDGALPEYADYMPIFAADILA